MFHFKKLLYLSIGFFIILSTTSCSDSKQKTLTIFNWGDYINEEVIHDFETETGIKVIYDTFSTNEDMWTKFISSSVTYDLVIPSDYMIERMIREDRIIPLDHSKIPNIKNLYPEFFQMNYDKGLQYSIPYFWGSAGIVYNTKNITETVDSWSILWNEKYMDKIIMMDAPRHTLMVALKSLGYSLNSTNPEELEAAKQLLIQQRPLVLAYANDNSKDMMLQGEADFAVMWSGEAYAIMVEQPDTFQYVLPKEGTSVTVDGMVIPKNAENAEAAYQFIDFILRPEVCVKNMEEIFYNTPNQAAYQSLPANLQDLLGELPFESIRKKESEIFVDLREHMDLYNNKWTEFKVSGK